MGVEFFFTHPKPGSLVVTSSLQVHSIPSNGEGKKTDSVGKCFCSTGALGLKNMNYFACMSRYHYALWECSSVSFATLPENKKNMDQQLQKEGMFLVKQQFNSSRHASNFFI